MRSAVPVSWLWLWLLLVPGLVGCSLIVDSRVDQCRTDNDCAVLGGTCDRATQLCVAHVAPGPDGPVDDGTGAQPDAKLAVAGDADLADVAGLGDVAANDAGGEDGSTGDAGAASDAGDSVSQSCDDPLRPIIRIEGEITASDRLECDRLYLLVGPVLVRPGVTLTIAPGTTLLGDGPSKGTLVVQPGARLIADGMRDAPIVFTSAQPVGMRKPGDWGGVILLGRAPTNASPAAIEGIVRGGEYGGLDAEDSSGVLRFVRIEYSGTRLGPNNEINGLTLGGVGRGTVIDHVMVRQTTDDCFEFFGGTVDARHLICQGNGDDGFDMDNGYRGRLQFLVVQQDPAVADETNGFEADNNPVAFGAPPVTEPTVYNATLCGRRQDVDREQYAVLVRRGGRAHIFNTVAVGFEAGLDVRDRGSQIDMSSTLLWSNHARLVAYEENDSNLTTQQDDDNGLDETDLFFEAARRNGSDDPRLADCFDRTNMGLQPQVTLTRNARTPPSDGFFDPQASYLGAFRDRNDRWADGAWVVWQAQ